MKELLYENKSLKFICHTINMGLVDVENIDTLQIISKNKPEFVVRVLDIDVTDYVFEIAKTSDGEDRVEQCETNFYDYIVFGTILEDGKKTLTTISLFELIMASGLSKENNFGNWSLDNEEWSLIKID